MSQNTNDLYDIFSFIRGMSNTLGATVKIDKVNHNNLHELIFKMDDVESAGDRIRQNKDAGIYTIHREERKGDDVEQFFISIGKVDPEANPMYILRINYQYKEVSMIV